MKFSALRPDPGTWKWSANPGAPPRDVRLLVKLRILAGGLTTLFGWLWLGFTLCFFWLSGGATMLRDVFVFGDNEIAEAEGVITSISDANFSINDRSVFAYHYEFQVDGELFLNNTRSFANRYKIGQVAEIEYQLDDPRYSRIINLDTGKSGLLISIPFVLIGFGLIFATLRNRLKGIRLLRDGILGRAVLLEKEETNSSVNDNPVYKYIFGYIIDEQGYEVTAKTHDETRFSGDPRLMKRNPDGTPGPIEESILYDPKQPKQSVLLDSLPGGPRINSQGDITCNLSGLIATLLLPSLVILGHGFWIFRILAP